MRGKVYSYNNHNVFKPAGLLHGTCKTEKGECREASVMTDACYDTHVIPFDENDSAAFNSRAANLSASVVELANAYYANSAFSINTGDTSVMDLNHKKLSQYSD